MERLSVEDSAVTKTMKALVLRRHGDLQDLEVVTDYPVPSAAEGHVVIRVRASSFNYHDVFTMRGMPGIKVPLPVVVGLDMAGEIVEVGNGVAGWKVGDRVLVNPLNKKKGLMGEMLDGGMAEYCLVSADQLVAMPEGVTFAEAAALPVAYGNRPPHADHPQHGEERRPRAGARRERRRRHRLRDSCQAFGRGGDRGGVERGQDGAPQGARRRRDHQLPESRFLEVGGGEIRQAAAPFLRGRGGRGGEFQRRRHLGAVVALHQARRQAPGVRRDRRPRPKEDLRYIWTFEINIVGLQQFSTTTTSRT